MATVSVNVNLEDFTARIGYLARTQVPFATALALSRCADEAVREIRGGLSSRFIVRNNWMSKGFRVAYAKKDHLVATVSHKDAFMALQEFGGEKVPLTAKDVAVPIGARPTPTATTPRSKWPGAIARRFTITKGGNVYEYARTGRRARGKHAHKGGAAKDARGYDPNIKLMYVYRKSVTVRPRLGAVAQCKKTLAETFGANFNGFLAFAVRTAK